eukprot:SAG31_NODE_4522_length_3168_cov_6.962529_2_plen_85_part_00
MPVPNTNDTTPFVRSSVCGTQIKEPPTPTKPLQKKLFAVVAAIVVIILALWCVCAKPCRKRELAKSTNELEETMLDDNLKSVFD